MEHRNIIYFTISDMYNMYTHTHTVARVILCFLKIRFRTARVRLIDDVFDTRSELALAV